MQFYLLCENIYPSIIPKIHIISAREDKSVTLVWSMDRIGFGAAFLFLDTTR